MTRYEQAELRWALRWADGDMGRKSTFACTLICLQLGVSHLDGGIISTDMDDRAVFAAGRERRVRRALSALSVRLRLALELTYGPVWNAPRLESFGRSTPVAVLAPSAIAAWKESSYAGQLPGFLRWLDRAVAGDPDLAARAATIRDEADALLREAECAYEAALDRSPLDLQVTR